MYNSKIRLWTAMAVAALLAWWLLRSIFLPTGGVGEFTVRLPKGASAGEIGGILAERGIIRSPLGFRLLALTVGKSASLKPGAYKLSPSMSPMVVLGKISRGETIAQWITFPEGFTLWQMAERLEVEGLGSRDRFYELAQHGGAFIPPGLPHPGSSLEGYLFPDTYLVPSGTGEDTIIREMLSCFKRKVAEPLAEDIAGSGMSLHQVVILASMIEREARAPKDRPLISAVLHNRLCKGMRLQVDATVLYALGGHKSRVLNADLAVDSPYNTYRYPGLPPGPIANPGLASIKAALHPADADYLYYVARPDGSHIFSRTYEEHLRAIKIARRRD